MSPIYYDTIDTSAKARAFMQALVDNGHIWHPEERAINCGIEPELAKLLQARMDECWQVLDDPCAIALDIMEAE